MTTLYRPHRVLLLRSRFRQPGMLFLHTRAELYPDRIELNGWGLQGRYSRTLPLADVARFEWHTERKGAPNLIVHLTDGTELPLIVEQSATWRDTLEHRLHFTTTERCGLEPARRVLNLSLPDLIAYTTSMA